MTDPGAPYCYRCPLCNRVTNWENLAKSATIHFALKRQTQKTYHICTNRKTANVQIIKPNAPGKVGEGDRPPTVEFIGGRCAEIPAEAPTRKSRPEKGRRMVTRNKRRTVQAKNKKNPRRFT